MCYSNDISKEYVRIKEQIENHDFTFLLLPLLDFESCVGEIVDRQIHRSDLNLFKEKEEQKIRKRLAIYTDLKCIVILTHRDKNKVALQIYRQSYHQICNEMSESLSLKKRS